MNSSPAPNDTHSLDPLAHLVQIVTEYGDFGKWPCDYFTHDQWLVHADHCEGCHEVKTRWEAEALWLRVHPTEGRWAA